MSTGPFYDVAKAMEAQLEGWPALAGVPVVIDQQKDIKAEIETAVAKIRGCCVSILFVGFRSVDKDTPGPRVRARYELRAWGLPIVQETLNEFLPAETCLAQVAKALHHFRPDGRTVLDEVTVEDGDLVPDLDFLIYETFVSVVIQL